MPAESDSARPLRGVAFLTCPAGPGRRILLAARARFPDVVWTVYFRVTQRAALEDALAGTDARSDKPAGSKLAFVRSIRRARPDIALVAWTGDEDYDRMKIVALASGARRIVVYDDAMRTFDVARHDGAWLRHAQWRLAAGASIVPTAVTALRFAYKWTVGLAFAAVWLPARMMRFADRRRTTDGRSG